MIRLALAVPATLLALAAADHAGPYWPAELIAPSGEWSARLLIVALCLTPLRLLFPGSVLVGALIRNRRSIGVAAFLYALAHLLFYLVDMERWSAIAAELSAPGIWTGWLAFLLLLPPALASNDPAMRLLRSGWKRVQRLAYPAAIITLAHWALVHDGLVAALVHFLPLAILQALRIATPKLSTSKGIA